MFGLVVIEVMNPSGHPWIINEIQAKLYIPSTLNIDLILWHTQLIVYAVKC